MSRFFQKRLQAISAADAKQIDAFSKLQVAMDGVVNAGDDQNIGYAIGTESFSQDKTTAVASLVTRVEDGLRTLHSAANLIQAQRDFFGSHTYERVDAPRGQFFHTEWAPLD